MSEPLSAQAQQTQQAQGYFASPQTLTRTAAQLRAQGLLDERAAEAVADCIGAAQGEPRAHQQLAVGGEAAAIPRRCSRRRRSWQPRGGGESTHIHSASPHRNPAPF